MEDDLIKFGPQWRSLIIAATKTRRELTAEILRIEATVLGLSVGLIGVRGGEAPRDLIASWVVLIVAIVFGFFALKGITGVEEASAARVLLFDNNIAAVEHLAENNEIDSERAKELKRASLVLLVPNELRSQFTTDVFKAARENTQDVPLKDDFITAREQRFIVSTVALWIAIFYSLSLLAAILLIAAVVTA